MIRIDIPGWGNIEIENLVLDLNGTIATDGKIPSEVKEKIKSLSDKAKIYILTADTQGTASEEISNMGVELLKVSEERQYRSEIKSCGIPGSDEDGCYRKWKQ